MTTLWFWLISSAALMLFGAKKQTSKVSSWLHKHNAPAGFLAKGIGMLILVAQFSELLRAIEHADPVKLVAALMLLGIMAADRKGEPERELRKH